MDRIMIVLVVLHLLTALVYAWDWYQDYDRWQECLIRLGISLFLPLVGVLLCKMVDYFAEHNAAAQMDELYLGRGKMMDGLELLRPIDHDREVDKAPALDVLKLDQYSLRRRLIMETLRQDDTLDYLSVLQEALSNEDRETSHYASTVIMDLQKQVQDGLERCRRAWEENPDDPACCKAYEQELYRTVTSGVFDKSTMGRYRARYGQLSDRLLAGERPEPDWFHHRIQLELAAGNNLEARRLAGQFLAACPDSEDAVVDQIEIFIRMADRPGLDRFLARLREMPVMLTSKSLPYIRFLS